MSVVTPGAIRIRAKAPDAVAETIPFPTGTDAVVEVQQASGEWLALRGITEARIHLTPNDFARASVEVELSSIDVMAPAEAVLWRAVPLV